MNNDPSREDKLIARYFKPLATHPGAFGLTDDAACFAPPTGHDLVLTTDAVLEGVHFLPTDPAEDVARKALRANLSDLAAKGAKPAGFLLSIALPAKIDGAWLERFCAGLAADAEAFECPLFGGDTDKTPGLLAITIFAFGHVPSGRMVRRAGANPGDIVAVSGVIGEAALGLMLARDASLSERWSLTDAERDSLIARYRVPQPRVRLAPILRDHVSAAMDVSDGLAGDLAKLCRVSGVTATSRVMDIPFSQSARKALAADPSLYEPLLAGGDDYEILCTVAPDRWDGFATAASAAGIAVTRIGTIAAGTQSPQIMDANGRPLVFAQPSHSHF